MINKIKNKLLIRIFVHTIICMFALFYAQVSTSLPQDGEVVSGDATITTQPTQVNVNQFTDKAIINWQSFNIDSGESTIFQVPYSTSITLNRVLGHSASEIYGNLISNGRLFIINSEGIHFGPTAMVDVAGLIASTLNITNQNFNAGNYFFSNDDAYISSIINDGTITVLDGGFVGLIAPVIENKGEINARLGDVILASGKYVTVDIVGDSLISFVITPDETALLNSNSSDLQARISNSGTINAQGGTVTLSAERLDDVLDGLINIGGNIDASNMKSVGNGDVILYAGGSGGNINIKGQLVKIDNNAKIKADGETSGGKINITGKKYLSITGDVTATGLNNDGGIVNINLTGPNGAAGLGGNIIANGVNGGSVIANINGYLHLASNIQARGLSGFGGNVKLFVTDSIIESDRTSIDVSGLTRGGNIYYSADNYMGSGVHIANSLAGVGGFIDFSVNTISGLSPQFIAMGYTQGGRIRIGGDYLGGRILDVENLDAEEQELLHLFRDRWTDYEPNLPMQNASAVNLIGNTYIDVSATGPYGDGGTVVLWSQNRTVADGTIYAKPGYISGQGGVVEVSSMGALGISADVNTSYAGDRAGTLLLDPKNITILDYDAYTLSPSFLVGGDQFGFSMDMEDEYLAVGVPGRGSFGGEVYLFESSDVNDLSAFVYKGCIGVSCTTYKDMFGLNDAGDNFGYSVALEKEITPGGIYGRLIVGAPSAAGYGNVGGVNTGQVWVYDFLNYYPDPYEALTGQYVYGRGGATGNAVPGFSGGWVEIPTIDPNELLGISVAVYGSKTIMGAPNDAGYGTVYIYDYQTQDYRLGQGIIDGVTPEAGAQFGYGISHYKTANEDYLIIGAPGKDSGYAGSETGAVYIFYDYSHWYNFNILGPTGAATAGFEVANIDQNDRFGQSTDIYNDKLVVGALYDDGSGVGSTSDNYGAVYMFGTTNGFDSDSYLEFIAGENYTGGKNLDLCVSTAACNLIKPIGRSVLIDESIYNNVYRFFIGLPYYDDGAADEGAIGMFRASGVDFNAITETSIPGPAATPWTYSDSPGSDVTLLATTLISYLNTTDVTLQANNDININTPLIYSSTRNLRLRSGRSVFINNDIVNSSIGGFFIQANEPNANQTYRDSGAAEITMASDALIDIGGNIAFIMWQNLGNGGDINLYTINSDSLDLSNYGSSGLVNLYSAINLSGGLDINTISFAYPTINLYANITTGEGQIYRKDTLLHSDLILTSGSGYDITFDDFGSAVDITTVGSGTESLTITTSGGGEFSAYNIGTSANRLQSFSNTGTGNSTIKGDIWTTGSIDFTGPLTLNTNDITFTTSNSSVSLGGDINATTSGAEGLTIAAGSGTVGFGNVGLTTPLDFFRSTGSGAITIDPGSSIVTTNDQLYSSAVGSSGGLTFTSTGSIARFNGDVVTTGIQNYNADVRLGNDLTFTSNNYNINFNDELNAISSGVQGLTVNPGTNNVTFNTVGGTNPLEYLTVNGTGYTIFKNNVTTNLAQTYNTSNIGLNGTITLDSTSGSNITFPAAVAVLLSGDSTLTINDPLVGFTSLSMQGTVSGNEGVVFNISNPSGAINIGAIGTITPLEYINLQIPSVAFNFDGSSKITTGTLGQIYNANQINFSAASVTFNAGLGNPISFTGPVSLSSGVDQTLVFVGGTASTPIIFNDAINAFASGVEGLTINTGTSPNIAYVSLGSVGQTTPLEYITTLGDGYVILNNNVTTSGGTSTHTYGAYTLLGGNVNLTGTTIDFNNTLNNVTSGGPYNLTITGNALLDVIGDITPINNLVVTGTTSFDGNVITDGTQTYTGAITLTADSLLQANGLSFGSTIDGPTYTLTLDAGAANNIIFNNPIGGIIGISTPLGGLTIKQANDVTFNSTANISNVELGTAAGTEQISGTVKFNQNVNIGNQLTTYDEPYNIEFLGSSTTINGVVDLNNTGYVKLGNSEFDYFQFPLGIRAGDVLGVGTYPSQVDLFGRILPTNHGHYFKVLNILGDSVIDVGDTAFAVLNIETLNFASAGLNLTTEASIFPVAGYAVDIGSVTGYGNLTLKETFDNRISRAGGVMQATNVIFDNIGFLGTGGVVSFQGATDIIGGLTTNSGSVYDVEFTGDGSYIAGYTNFNSYWDSNLSFGRVLLKDGTITFETGLDVYMNDLPRVGLLVLWDADWRTTFSTVFVYGDVEVIGSSSYTSQSGTGAVTLKGAVTGVGASLAMTGGNLDVAGGVNMASFTTNLGGEAIFAQNINTTGAASINANIIKGAGDIYSGGPLRLTASSIQTDFINTSDTITFGSNSYVVDMKGVVKGQSSFVKENFIAQGFIIVEAGADITNFNPLVDPGAGSSSLTDTIIGTQDVGGSGSEAEEEEDQNLIDLGDEDDEDEEEDEEEDVFVYQSPNGEGEEESGKKKDEKAAEGKGKQAGEGEEEKTAKDEDIKDKEKTDKEKEEKDKKDCEKKKGKWDKKEKKCIL